MHMILVGGTRQCHSYTKYYYKIIDVLKHALQLFFHNLEAKPSPHFPQSVIRAQSSLMSLYFFPVSTKQQMNNSYGISALLK